MFSWGHQGGTGCCLDRVVFRSVEVDAVPALRFLAEVGGSRNVRNSRSGFDQWIYMARIVSLYHNVIMSSAVYTFMFN